MKIVVISNSGEFLPICWRLKREGTDCSIYIHQPRYKHNYDGILPKIPLKNLKEEVGKADIIVFGGPRPNERTKQDIALLKNFGLKANLPGVFGPVAAQLSKDHRVIGGSDELELDRKKGIELAEKTGFAIPEYHEFENLTDGARFLKGRSDLWVFKNGRTYVERFPGELMTKMLDEWLVRKGDECEYVLQKKIDGVELSSEVWIGGARLFNRTLKSKTFCTQSNTVWVEKGTELQQITAHLKGYIGPCSVNCIWKESIPYFLKWRPRFSWDAFYGLATLIDGKLSDFFLNDNVKFFDGYAVSERLSTPPYPYSNPVLLRNFAEDVSIPGRLEDEPAMWFQDIYMDAGKLRCAGADGIIGICTAKGKTLEEAWGRLYHNIGKLKVCSHLQYRTNSLKEHRKRCNQLQNRKVA